MAIDTGLVVCGVEQIFTNQKVCLTNYVMGDIVIFSKSNEHYFEKKHLYTTKINAIFADGRKQIELW